MATHYTTHEQPLAPVSNGYPVAAADNSAHVSQGLGLKEAKKMHKVLEGEGKHEDSTIAKQVKEISSAEKAERNAQKADEQAIKHHSKAVGAEHKANKDLERAQAKHDQAVREAQKTNNEIAIKQQHHVKVTSALQEAKTKLEQLSIGRDQHTPQRQNQLNELDQIINSAKAK